MPRIAPRIVRRYDVLGRPYYLHLATGVRRSRVAWQNDLARRKTTGTVATRPPRSLPTPAAVASATPDVFHAPTPAFPPGVGPTGRPEGVFEEATEDADEVPFFEVDDESDYQEGKGS